MPTINSIVIGDCPRSAAEQAADSDSETDDDSLIQSMVTCFRKTLAKKEKGEEEFITLPNNLR